MNMPKVLLVGLIAGMTAVGRHSRTFNKDVLPVLQKNCQGCHRPGEMAPMSLLTYNDARPWAKAMKQAVATKKMPPWFAEKGHFANDRSLSQAEIDTIVAWADNGAVEGDAKDKPAPISFPDGWNIKPDMIVEMPKDFHVPATGTINYQNIKVKVNFPEDMWVVAAEMRAGNPKVVHHGRVIVLPPGAAWMKNAAYGEAYEEGSEGMGGAKEGTDLLGKYNPGFRRAEFRHRRLGEVYSEGFRSGVQSSLHLRGNCADGSHQGRAGVCETSARVALLDVARNARGVQPGDSGGRQER